MVSGLWSSSATADDSHLLLPHHHTSERKWVDFYVLPFFIGTDREATAFYWGRGLFRMRARPITFLVCGMPLVALITCIVIALTYHFEAANKTHCKVYNVLPSISTVIGGFPATRLVWSNLIYLHIGPRYLAAYAYLRFFERHPAVPSVLRYIVFTLDLCQLTALLSLTYFDSIHNHPVHVASFTVFGSVSMLHMLLHVLIYRRWQRHLISRTTLQSLRSKRKALTVALGSLCICAYLFYRHNTYCEPYVFSLFAIFEYMFVVAVIVFHATYRFDFEDTFFIAF